MSREDGYTARLIIHRPAARGGDLEIEFETWQGGTLGSGGATKHRNPVTRKETARGAGKRSRETLTLTRECDAEAWALIPDLEDSIDIDACTGIRQMVDGRTTAIGNPFTVTGIVDSVKYPDFNLSGNDVGMLTVEIATDEDRA